ncbi:MAG: undecaprenyldiphospho-muramoylpentapeptide beta-N-acetylglucosaminyltransferase [Methylacidiphilales bacterium]|nr:undecaprenyldiphospho-muramoylpentapeptide beta-N-acetylglucosaminyltransferase [Candidatus Methylacidiphilales bacterium]
MKIVISGGGTGGHIYPAIAIANAIRVLHPNTEILFIGAEGKMEMEKVPQAGYAIEGLPIRGFDRSALLKSAFTVPFLLWKSLRKARRILQQFKPDVAIGVGGYASGPTLRVASRLGIPTLIQEQNAFAGLTNQLLGKRAAKICVAYEGMEQFFPKATLRLTGNPVRNDIATDLEKKKATALQYFGLSANSPIILVFGGSLGARTLNEALANNSSLLGTAKVQVLWQAGKIYIEKFSQTETARLPNVVIMPFIDKMDLAYAAADVIIGRAGALTIAELCLVGKPAILVPSPNVSEDHQTKNAVALVTKDAAILVKDQEASTQLIPKALALLQDTELRARLASQIKLLAKPNAAEDIAKEVLELVKNP